MARKSQVRFFPERGGYFTTYNGRRYRLETCSVDDGPSGPHFTAALTEYLRIMQEDGKPAGQHSTLGAVLDSYTAHVRKRNERSASCLTSLFKAVKDSIGHVRLGQLLSRHLTGFIEEYKGWGPTSKLTVFQKLQTCFLWSVEQGGMATNPLAGVRASQSWQENSRGAEHVVPDSLRDVLLATAKGSFRQMLLALVRTGARPGELCNAEGHNYRQADQMIVFLGHARRGYIWKNARKKKKGDPNRYIQLDDQVDEFVRFNLAKGDLCFRNAHGERWTPDNLRRHLDRLMNSLPVKTWLAVNGQTADHYCPYSFRHTFITKAIIANVPIKDIADLCGTSVKEIEQTYSHATADTKHMRRAFLRAIQ